MECMAKYIANLQFIVYNICKQSFITKTKYGSKYTTKGDIKMFCKNCGKENNDGSLCCKYCGQDFSEKVSNNVSTNSVQDVDTNSKSKNKPILFVGLGAVVIVVLGLILFFALRTTTPNVSQLENDFVAEMLNNEEYTITEFNIISETDGKNDNYKAVVEMVYNDSNIEYHRHYEFVYDKYKEWTLNHIVAYEAENWQVLPKVAPTASDYIDNCEKELSYATKFDTFTAVDEKTIVDLTTGEATLFYSVTKDTTIQDISGEIEFNFTFNEKSEKWEMVDYSYADSYIVEYDLVKTWSGDGYPYLMTANENNKVNFVFEVTKCENDTVEGVLKYGGKSYNLAGTLSDTLEESVVLNLTNEGDKKSISLSVQFDGSATADIDTQYIPSQTIYYGYMMSKYEDVEMVLN